MKRPSNSDASTPTLTFSNVMNSPRLASTPSCPEPRLLLDGGYVSEGRDGVYLDRQLSQFASVVGDLICDYPKRHWEDLAFDFFDEIRIAIALGHNYPGRTCGVEAPLDTESEAR